MPLLYIGNASRQSIDFVYRIPGAPNARKQVIRPGMQERIAGELAIVEIDAILKQHARYGLVKADEIDRAREFHGTCYSIDKPIRAPKIVYLMERNIVALVKQGEQTRQECAVAENLNFERTLVEQGRSERVTAFEMTMQQENHDPLNPNPQLSEGIRVARDEPRPAARVKLRGKRVA